MNLSKHISKNRFYEVLEKRLYEYREAIFGNRMTQGMSLAMLQATIYNIDQLKILDSQTSLFGSGFWGYGINEISIGKETHSHLDVQVIKKTAGLNKHHESYRILLLLIFKIENEALLFNFFALDTCKVSFNSNINLKYKLSDLDNAELRVRGNNIFIDLIFKALEKPVTFQIETYHVGGHLSGMALARYYIDTITKLAIDIKKREEKITGEKDIGGLNKRIDKIENELRFLIAETLRNETGKEDFESLLTGDAKREVRERIKKFLDINPHKTKEDFKSLKIASQFLDIAHLKKIILKAEYWPYFALKFRDHEKTHKYFDQFSEIRHAVKHAREITELVLLEGNAAMKWLEIVI